MSEHNVEPVSHTGSTSSVEVEQPVVPQPIPATRVVKDFQMNTDEVLPVRHRRRQSFWSRLWNGRW